MIRSGYTGISFPFRVSPQGGVVMSTTDEDDPTHIVESIQQIFGTDYLQRVMEPEIYSTITPLLFEPNNVSLQNTMRLRIIDDLERLEERVEVTEDNIDFEVDKNILYATITFRVVDYDTWYINKFKVGEV